MLDVGQGDGLIVRFPGGNTLAIDGGPSRRMLADYLGSQGIGKLDYAVLSHAHSDHYSGLTPVLGLVPADCAARIFDPGLDRVESSGYQDFRRAAGCRYRTAALHGTLAFDPAVEVTVLSAYAKRYGSSDDSHGINNTSAVLQLRYGRFSMLFEGDAEEQAEQGTYGIELPLLHSTVLKAGHHGSCTATGTSYLAAVAPQYVLISAGRGNSYGLPNCQTIGKLKSRAGLRWSRTDENGTVVVTTDGVSYAVARSRGAENIDTCPRYCTSPLDF